MKPTRTWILIADGSGARILEAFSDGAGFREHSISGGRHMSSSSALVETAPPHRIEERPGASKALEALFASQLGTMLAGYLRDDAFDRLVVVAPSSTLGKLRRMITPEVREKITIEIEKDLTDIPTVEIPRYLGDVTALA